MPSFNDVKEFFWGALACAFGETSMHPVDTLKTRIQTLSQPSSLQHSDSLSSAFRSVVQTDGIKGLYRGVTPSITGSLVTGATYFGIIELSRNYLLINNPNLLSPWSHFIAGAVGEAIGSVVYVPCEVIKQRMQLQGSFVSWKKQKANASLTRVQPHHYNYYHRMVQAGRLIIAKEGYQGLYSGYFSTLARDLPFAGLQIMFYEMIKSSMRLGKEKLNMDEMHISQTDKHNYKINNNINNENIDNSINNDKNDNNYNNDYNNAIDDKFIYDHDFEKMNHHRVNEFSSAEELMIGGIAGGVSAALTTPMDVIKTRLQTQGSGGRYRGWTHALLTIFKEEGYQGLLKGWMPRVIWFVPASALTFMALDLLHKAFDEEREEERNVRHSKPNQDKKSSETSDMSTGSDVVSLRSAYVEPCS